MMELPLLEKEKIAGGTGYGESSSFLDMLSLRCLVNIQVEMCTRSLKVFYKFNDEGGSIECLR